MRIVQARYVALTIAVAGAFGLSSPASAQGTASAAASAMSLQLVSQGNAMALNGIAKATGNAARAFTHSAQVPLLSESLNVIAGGNLIGALAVTVSGVQVHASSNGGRAAAMQTEADTSIASAQITLALVPPPDSTQPAAAPLLSIAVTNLAAQVLSSATAPSATQQTGTANFGSLAVTGTMVGSQSLSFAGPAPANTVLYDDPNLTITLNQQNDSGVIECTPTCIFVPDLMVADALLVELFHKPLTKTAKMSGTMIIGQDQAGLP